MFFHARREEDATSLLTHELRNLRALLIRARRVLAQGQPLTATLTSFIEGKWWKLC